MASSKISDLTDFTLADLATNFDDALGLFVDTLDTTQAPTGTDKKVVGLTLAQYLGLKPIQTITLTSGAPGEFDFTSIPDYGHKEIFISGKIRSTRAAQTIDDAYVYFNNLTSPVTDYYSQRLYGSDASTTAAEVAAPLSLMCAAVNAPTDCYSPVTISIQEYLGATVKDVWGTYGANRVVGSTMLAGVAYMCHDSLTSAITRVTVASGNSATLFGTLDLYLKF